MTTRQELSHLSLSELEKAYDLLEECLQLINPNDEKLSYLSLNGKDMTLQIELARITIYARIQEIKKLMNLK